MDGINYPVLFVGTVGLAVFIFLLREKNKNVYTATPILTVHPSTNADMSQIANIQNLANYDVQQLEAGTNPSLATG